MKKVVVILLLLVYGLSSTGTTIHLHYCCGKLDAVSFSSAYVKACPTKTVSSKGCCDNKHVELKVKGDQEPAAKFFNAQKNLVAKVAAPLYHLVVDTHEVPVNEYATGPPKAAPPVPLFIQHCSYLI